ncbi:MAG: response regulator [Vicinamibacterales bacterium]
MRHIPRSGDTEPMMTVLAVDDTPSALALLTATLATEPYRVLTAASGAECLTLAAQERPDVILLDVMMPGMSGFDVCEHLRRMPELEDVAVLMLTALDDRPARLSAFNAGADDFLTKPCDRVELRLRLRGIARLTRCRRLAGHTALPLADGSPVLDEAASVLLGCRQALSLASASSAPPTVSLADAIRALDLALAQLRSLSPVDVVPSLAAGTPPEATPQALA